jgi:CubicO group peptidase (beta-lactamase class C family)
LRAHGQWPALLVSVLVLAVAPNRPARAAQVSLDTVALKRIPARLQQFVDEGVISGAVTLVGRHDKVASLEAVGYADLSSQRPMRTDSLFWIASMTKPITAVAVLMLQDEGKLSVDDPVEKHLPEFKNQWMIAEKATDRLVLVPPARPITLRDLLTHTSGLGDVPAPRPNASLAELVTAYAREPLQFAPGSKWSYCNSGINTLGRIVEVVSGRRYETFLQHRVFNPLGMKDTTFWPTPAQAKRLAKSYQPTASGSGLEETEIFFIKGRLSDRTRTPMPAGGLFSTAPDIARFYQMMLNGGEWRGRRRLSREAVVQLTRTQTGDLRTGFTDGMSFGLGFAVVKQPQGVTAMLAPGTFGHGGAYGTQSWADPQKDMIYVLMIQRARLPNADASAVRRAFQEAAAAARRD